MQVGLHNLKGNYISVKCVKDIHEYREYEADFVFNPRNHLIKNNLEKRGADFDKEQIKMVYTHKLPEYETTCIEPLSDAYIDQYLEMHSKDVYCTGYQLI